MIDKLIEANINNDPACLTVVEDLLKTLYAAWKDVVENPRPDGVPSPALQPEEYKKYIAEHGPDSVKLKQDEDNASDGTNLRLMA
jgi:flagellar protein FliS